MKTEIQCLRCGEWFESPVQFMGQDNLNNSVVGGNTQCPACGKATRVDKHNMKLG